MLTLGIETSCDETAAAVIQDGERIISNIIASQMDEHAQYGGVVPEIASRRHVENICQVVDAALHGAGIEFKDVDLFAVTAGPGLAGALLVGMTAAKSYALAAKKPLVGVHHVVAHVSANFLLGKQVEFPALCLTVSGGHTALLLVHDYAKVEQIGATRDDAAGEAFDKTARLLKAGYPGGPAIERLAAGGSPVHNFLPRGLDPSLGLDFSFSGLKSAVANYVGRAERDNVRLEPADLAASVQQAILNILVSRLGMALDKYPVKSVMLAGGVSANRPLGTAVMSLAQERGKQLYIPPSELCTDNAAMVASAGYYKYCSTGEDSQFLNIRTDWPL